MHYHGHGIDRAAIVAADPLESVAAELSQPFPELPRIVNAGLDECRQQRGRLEAMSPELTRVELHTAAVNRLEGTNLPLDGLPQFGPLHLAQPRRLGVVIPNPLRRRLLAMGTYPARYWHVRRGATLDDEPLPRNGLARRRALDIRRIFLIDHRGHATLDQILAVCRARDLLPGLAYEAAPVKAALRPICTQVDREIDWSAHLEAMERRTRPVSKA